MKLIIMRPVIITQALLITISTVYLPLIPAMGENLRTTFSALQDCPTQTIIEKCITTLLDAITAGKNCALVEFATTLESPLYKKIFDTTSWQRLSEQFRTSARGVTTRQLQKTFDDFIQIAEPQLQIIAQQHGLTQKEGEEYHTLCRKLLKQCIENPEQTVQYIENAQKILMGSKALVCLLPVTPIIVSVLLIMVVVIAHKNYSSQSG